MRLADLERESGVAITTIKYYLREGLLPKGRTITATRSEYSDSHVARLKLIKALVRGAGMSIAQVREIIATIENPPAQSEQFGAAQSVATPPMPDSETEEHPIVTELAPARGWAESPKPRAMLSHSIRTMEEAGLEPDAKLINAYADAMAQVARVDVRALRGREQDTDALVTLITAGTITTDSALLALRRLEQRVQAMQEFPERYADD